MTREQAEQLSEKYHTLAPGCACGFTGDNGKFTVMRTSPLWISLVDALSDPDYRELSGNMAALTKQPDVTAFIRHPKMIRLITDDVAVAESFISTFQTKL